MVFFAPQNAYLCDMSKKGVISPFYGGGLSLGQTETGCPLQGDPIDDLIARTKAEMEDQGYSFKEVQERINKEPYNARIVITKDAITLDGFPLEKLTPSERAFYILVCSHPEGLEVGKFHDEHIDDYQDIFWKLNRKRKEKEKHGVSFELDRRASHYKDSIKKAIEKIEQEHPGVNLSSCKIYGEKKWRIQTKLVWVNLDLMGKNPYKEL